MTLPMFTNSDGKRDFLLTASVTALATVLAKVLLAGVSFKGFTFGAAPDAALVGALLVPTLGAYTYKRVELKKAANAPAGDFAEVSGRAEAQHEDSVIEERKRTRAVGFARFE